MNGNLRCIGTAVLAVTLFTFDGGHAADRPTAFVSVAPQRFFVEKIGPERVRTIVMVQPGASPATYEPKPGQMVALSRAAVYFAVGVPFERAWLDRIARANTSMQIVHTDAGIEKLPMTDPVHDHGAASAPDSSGPGPGIPDPHIWLSPPLVKMQIRHIRNGLIAADPSYRAVYERNTEQFIRELERLDEELRRLFEAKAARRFMVFHPAWGYFARAYGLEQVPIEIEGKSPKPAELMALIEQARKNDIRVIFVQPQFSAKAAELIAREIGAEVVVADPLAPDWAANLRRVAGAVAKALR